MRIRFLLMVLVSLVGVRAANADGGAEHDCLRFVEDAGAEGEARLETAILRFRNPDGVQVDLVGAVHIADKAYFEDLNRRFVDYEVVLYELVGGPESLRGKRQMAEGEESSDLGQGSEAGAGKLAWLGVMQQWMKEKLGLSSQLLEIDYGAANFVHADMDVQGFLDTQKEKKETFLGLWLKAVQAQADVAASAPSGKQQPGLAKILEWMMKDDGSNELKRLVGREFDGVEAMMAGVEGENGTVIIGERNRVAVTALQEQVDQGRQSLAVFYGAAHLPDLANRLEAIGFAKSGGEWLTAWRIEPEEVTAKVLQSAEVER